MLPLFYLDCDVLILIDLLARGAHIVLQCLLFLQERGLFDHDGVPEVGESLLEGIRYLSLRGGELPSSGEILILQLFQLSL